MWTSPVPSEWSSITARTGRAYWAECVTDRIDQFGMAGYVVMLLGQQVPGYPHARAVGPRDPRVERPTVTPPTSRADALTVRQLDLHSPKWQWL